MNSHGFFLQPCSGIYFAQFVVDFQHIAPAVRPRISKAARSKLNMQRLRGGPPGAGILHQPTPPTPEELAAARLAPSGQASPVQSVKTAWQRTQRRPIRGL